MVTVRRSTYLQSACVKQLSAVRLSGMSFRDAQVNGQRAMR